MRSRRKIGKQERSIIEESSKEMSRQRSQSMNIADSMAQITAIKMMHKTRSWSDQLLDIIGTNLEKGNYKKASLQLRLRSAVLWLNDYYQKRALNNDGGGFIAGIMFMFIEIFRGLLILSIYALLIALIVWTLPYFIDWILHLE